jgi:glutaminyl-peptide cyclotransferase
MQHGGTKLGLTIVFFDGEEAFKDWTETDSLYGSKHLAARWESENQLGSIELMVLIDLIGASKPTFHNFYENTTCAFDRMRSAERKLTKAKLISGLPRFTTQLYPHSVEDDHKPFVQRKVPVIHVIPAPFPTTWHTRLDTLANIDPKEVNAFARILRVFAAEYIGLELAKDEL